MMGEPLASSLEEVVRQMRQASEGDDWPWMGVLLVKGADEIESLRAALELIARSPGGIPGPRIFAEDVITGRVRVQATNGSGS